jgi:membrane-associated protein
MEFLKYLIDIVLHLDVHLFELVSRYGTWTYAILCLILFCETGLVVTPFLPGDSLLFAVGALAATGALDIGTVCVLLGLAVIAGDNTNYWIGHTIGPRVFHNQTSRLLNRKHLERTRHFYEKYGAKTIVIARFIPIVRTFAPFVAGIGRMVYTRFLLFSIAGGLFWILLLTFAGYFFGNIPIVKQNFSLVIVAIVLISIMPPIIEYLSRRFRRSPESSEEQIPS